MSNATVDEKVLGECLNEMPRALLQSDVWWQGQVSKANLIEMASQNTGSGSSTSLGSLFDSDVEENSAPSVPTIEADRDTEELDSFSKKRSYLLSKMSFSKQEVDMAVSELGECASIDQLVNWIVTAQEATTEPWARDKTCINIVVIGDVDHHWPSDLQAWRY
ncbi:probable inactive DNA (cytosine-5)-methyltransferase DRM3 isoform X2 [Triticum dicoccoides]|uniref:probable inactive DNA (cytosine-5)-methyltransferase DRM3 isoform X2 n=1 Tax=Triticum dicoccoides TaxID=85692 RepID=UPI000E7C1A70|nr:probable inactive DNA (cytosine-5)-methyltransferase DRM3 isoform X2 [Triticum dicoccoides]